MTTVRWEPKQPTEGNRFPMPPMLTALCRGALGRCPSCGGSRIFNGYLKVRAACDACAAPVGLARAEDAPPYFTILIVGHILVPLLFFVDRNWELSSAALSGIFVPTALIMSLGLLRPIKGATVGAMMKLDLMKSDMDAV